MWKNLIRYLVIPIAIIAVVTYLWLLNPEQVSFTYKQGTVWQGPLALLLIVTFLTGTIFSAIFSFFFGTLRLFSDWLDARKRKTALTAKGLFVVGREYLATGVLDDAESTFRKILLSTPDDIIARTSLAQTLQQKGDLRSALIVLEQARPQHSHNLELLVMLAELNDKLGNKTAAYDNLSLVLKSHPQNIFALEKLVGYCTALERIDEAIQYQRQLIRLNTNTALETKQEQLADLEFLVAKKTQDEATLEELLKKNRNYAPAMAELASILETKGNFDKASKLLIKAFDKSTDVKYLGQLATLWLKLDDPSKAISQIRAAIKSGQNDENKLIAASLFLVNLLLHLEVIDEARIELNKIDALSKSAPDLSSQYQPIINYFLAITLSREHNNDEAVELMTSTMRNLLKLPNNDFFSHNKKLINNIIVKTNRIKNQPQPSLSTP